jgi:hypothetical protein
VACSGASKEGVHHDVPRTRDPLAEALASSGLATDRLAHPDRIGHTLRLVAQASLHFLGSAYRSKKDDGLFRFDRPGAATARIEWFRYRWWAMPAP